MAAANLGGLQVLRMRLRAWERLGQGAMLNSMQEPPSYRRLPDDSPRCDHPLPSLRESRCFRTTPFTSPEAWSPPYYCLWELLYSWSDCEGNKVNNKDLPRCRQISINTSWPHRSRWSLSNFTWFGYISQRNAGLKYSAILRSILSLPYANVGVPCREAFYERFYADRRARGCTTASSHLALIKAQSTALTSWSSDISKFARIAKCV